MNYQLQKLSRKPVLVALSLSLILALMLTASCIGGTSSALGRTYQGPILQLTLEEVVNVPEVVYTDYPSETGELQELIVDPDFPCGKPGEGSLDAKDYIIKPSSEGNELVVIRARLGNHAATRALVNVDALPAELRMDTGRYYAVNTYEARAPFDGFYLDKNTYTPLLRGSLELLKNCSLIGWMVFDVPMGAVAESLKWEAGGDIIIIDM